MKHLPRPILAVALAIVAAAAIIGMGDKRSDSAVLSKHLNRDATVYLRVQPVPPPFSGSTLNGITLRNEAPVAVSGKITATSDEGVLVRSGASSCFIPKDMIAAISFAD